MTAKRLNIFAAGTLCVLLLAAPALADGWWEPAPLPGGVIGKPDPNLDPALHEMFGLVAAPTSWPLFFPLWAPRCYVAVPPVSNNGRARPSRPVQICE